LAGWSVDRKIEFFDEFQHIINETLQPGFASILRNDDYEYYASLPWPKGARKDSKYGLLFRASLSSIADAALTVERWAFNDEPKLYIVCESGHPNAPDAIRLYNFFRDRFQGQSKALAGLDFKGDYALNARKARIAANAAKLPEPLQDRSADPLLRRLLRCATRHTRGTRKYTDRVVRQIVAFFEQVASDEHS
jgi:hypothetical protein